MIDESNWTNELRALRGALHELESRIARIETVRRETEVVSFPAAAFSRERPGTSETDELGEW